MTTMATDSMTTDAFADRLFQAALGAAETMSVYLGDRLGWYRALAEGGPATAAELTQRAGGADRYAEEWLEQQAVIGILTVTEDGRFALPPAAAEVLTDTASLSYLAPLARMFCAAGMQLPALTEAYRSGGGVGWTQFGTDMRESQADMNRPWFERQLPDALAGVPDVHHVLNRHDARFADVGCGAGWSSLALARAYPQATVDGYDTDLPSIQAARANAESAGLSDRVHFHHADAAGMADRRYDATFAFECLHDMTAPVHVLAAMRRSMVPDGLAIVMEEAVADTFQPLGDDVERLMYGFSILICLPDSMAHQPTAGTGTVMRADTLRRFAREAGFSGATTLPIEDFGFWRFYKLET